MPSDQQRRDQIARNESLFREVNERMDDRSDGHQGPGDEVVFLCECGAGDCTAFVRLTGAQYEAVRAHPRRFFMIAGHEIPDTERVVEEHGDWVVTEKDEDVATIVEARDPRR